MLKPSKNHLDYCNLTFKVKLKGGRVRGIFRTQSNIYDEAQMFDGVLSNPLEVSSQILTIGKGLAINKIITEWATNSDR